MDLVRALVGNLTEVSLDVVDFAVTPEVGLFVPVSGQCRYAVAPAHTHPSYSFVLSFDDACRVRVDGRLLRSVPGTFSGFAPGVPHQELPLDRPARYVAIMVRADFFERQAAWYGRPLPELRGRAFPSTPRLMEAVRELMSEYDAQGPGAAALLAATGLRITHLLIRQMLGGEPTPEKVDFRMAANDAVELMHRRLGERISVASLARAARLSVSQFARVFKQELGMAPIEYLLELRLLRAKCLLRDGDASVTDIALACGFGSSAYLSRSFRRRFGASPSLFRASLGRRCADRASEWRDRERRPRGR